MSARSRLSASSRVMLAMAVTAGLTVVVLVAVAYVSTARSLEASLDEALAREADAYSAAVESAPTSAALTSATRTYLKGRTSTGSGVDPVLLVVMSDGHTISNSELRLERAAGNVDADRPPVAPRFRTVTLEGATYRLLSVPVASRGRTVGVFQAALASASATTVARDVAVTLLAAGLVALALGVLLSQVATRAALFPLTRMAEDAARISDSTTSHALAYDGPADELGALASALNGMLARLDAAAADQRAFVADASHELRTPVAVIRGNAELLAAGALSGRDSADSLHMIVDESDRLTRLLDELLALARLESVGRAHFQPLSVSVLVAEAVARGKAMCDCEFSADASGCDAWVSGDPDLLDQALANLSRNAAAHVTSGGHVHIGCDADDAEVHIHVSDDGPGFAPDSAVRIFDRFYRDGTVVRDDASGGAGLGLAIVKRLVELHGGSVGARNLEPHGACFTITLPRIAPPN